MRKRFLILLSLALTFVASPAVACFSRCAGNVCVTGEIKTYMGCYIDNGVCYDAPMPLDACWSTETRVADSRTANGDSPLEKGVLVVGHTLFPQSFDPLSSL